MDKLKTDGDIMVYLRNMRIALQKISAQTGLSIDIRATPDGYAYVYAGDYTAIQFRDGHEKYEYWPKDIEKWERIKPGQVTFGKAPGAGKQSGTQ